MDYITFYTKKGNDIDYIFPYKINVTSHIVISSGTLECSVNFDTYKVKAPSMAIFFPGQVISEVNASEDFECFGMSMDSRFFETHDLPISFEEKFKLSRNHFFELSQEMMEALTNCYRQVETLQKQEANPYQDVILEHLFSAYYYGLGYYIHRLSEPVPEMTRKDEICKKFIVLASSNFMKHRDISFYAKRIFIGEKYLSSILKEKTGRTALEWIERYVIIYAKSCLASTTMTIQEISNDLDFPSQSVFGKYFKRVVGMSPKAWRQKRNLQMPNINI
ncbi:MAG: helix-turn-helix domain-containing protein [Candidatus Cryptobacteroides sp.]